MKVQQHLKTQRKIGRFVRRKSWISRSTTLSEELGVLAKAKDVISEKTDDSEYRPVNAVIERRFGRSENSN